MGIRLNNWAVTIGSALISAAIAWSSARYEGQEQPAGQADLLWRRDGASIYSVSYEGHRYLVNSNGGMVAAPLESPTVSQRSDNDAVVADSPAAAASGPISEGLASGGTPDAVPPSPAVNPVVDTVPETAEDGVSPNLRLTDSGADLFGPLPKK